MVQRPFYPEGETSHVYLLHPPGGVVGGDALEVLLTTEDGANVLVTTPAANKIYRSRGVLASQCHHLTVVRGATLEWLPQETIVFDGACVDMTTRVDLELGARFIGWDILCLGRPASGEAFRAGHCQQRFEIWQDDRPLMLERSRLEGGSAILEAAWGLAGKPVVATLVAAPAAREDLETVRRAVPEAADELFSATLLDEVLVCRYLGAQAEPARLAFTRAWAVLRPGLLGRPACPPRIWRT